MTGFDPAAWQSTSIDTNDNDGPPDPGEYEVEIRDAAFFISKAGNPIIKFDLRVTDSGYEWTEIRGMNTGPQMKAAKATCARLGIDVDSVDSEEGLKQAVKTCVGHYYKVAVVQNGDYRNTYFNDRVHASQPAFEAMPTSTPVSALDDADPVPF